MNWKKNKLIGWTLIVLATYVMFGSMAIATKDIAPVVAISIAWLSAGLVYAGIRLIAKD